MNREQFKIIAMFLMFLDHAYYTVVSSNSMVWMTCVGRIAFPMFAFLIVEGFHHTSNRKKYLLRMFLFALVSEIPFNLMMSASPIYPFDQNVMFTFTWGILFLMLIEWILNRRFWIGFRIVLLVPVCLSALLLGTITFVDYKGYGVLTVIFFYLAYRLDEYKKGLGYALIIPGMIYINFHGLGGKTYLLPNGMLFPEQGLAVLSLVFIFLYNGKKAWDGKKGKVFQYVSYLFYPLHILLLSLIALC